MKDKEIIKKRIIEEEDFIYCPRLGNSLSKLIEKYPDGIEDERIEKVLLISPQELKEIYESAIKKLKKSFDKGNVV